MADLQMTRFKWQAALQNQFSQWLGRFHKLSHRDQIALKLLGAFGGLLFLVYGILLPAFDYHQNSQYVFTEQQQLFSWMKAKQPAVEQLQQTPQSPGTTQKPSRKEDENPISLINNSAKDFQLSIQRLQPEANGNQRIWMEKVSFKNTIEWLNHLQVNGLELVDVSLDQQQPGIVNVRATLQSMD
ncbi:type II secretion system protein M [Aestuariicella hydrocarbonica]|uniref:Type II secretion system protein M n=1 Tax=Pseudomaricurvus hydrocarbonicus TaxID=1470433 RepID=A0A9E5JRB1_9GAMM|nr:type II secretion system protein M [Aestuariicella hydrocarbonica]NHO63946.1 type II secretion system protein M [Aestuariicella hydrocarbonica]